MRRFSGETVVVIDDNAAMLELMSLQLMAAGLRVVAFESAREMLDHDALNTAFCVISDLRMPGMDGLELQKELNKRGIGIPFIIVTAHGDVSLAVDAMRGGAIDIVEKPFSISRLLSAVERASSLQARSEGTDAARNVACSGLATLTERENEILALLTEGKQSKVIAASLGIAERTVAVHRANIMRKLNVRTIGELIRLVLDTCGAERIGKRGASPSTSGGGGAVGD
jgi:FixJ family two-component response regulator